MTDDDEKRAAYERAVARHRKASPARVSTLRVTERLIAATATVGFRIRTEALVRAASRHVHPRRQRPTVIDAKRRIKA